MDAATQSQIFEPFFTTKAVGEGTGLGLATVFGIVKQHEGFIDVDSAPGAGCRITVFLPLVDGPPPRTARIEALDAPGGTETILLAEDDPSVRIVVEQMLEEAGYRVVSTFGCFVSSLDCPFSPIFISPCATPILQLPLKAAPDSTMNFLVMI